MLYSFKVTIRVVFKQLRFLLPLFAMIALINYGFFRSYTINNAGPINFLYLMLPSALLGLPYFAFVTYELVSQPFRMGSLEVVQSNASGEPNLFYAIAGTSLISIGFWTVSPIGWAIWNYLDQANGYSPLLVHSLLSILLYWIGPSLIGISLGLSLFRSSRPLAIGIILLATLLSSQLPMKMFGMFQYGRFVPADFLDWFRLTVPITFEWPDPVYGVPMEFSRWVLVAFWIFALSLITLNRMAARRRRFWIKMIFILTLSTTLSLARFAYRSHDSMNIRDLRPSSPGISDNRYYAERASIQTIPAFFSVEAYDLDIRIGSRLKVTATMHLKATDLQNFDFTLHHDLRVRAVEDDQGRRLNYQQDHDIVSVIAIEPTVYISMHYDGYVGKYFSNYQGVTLPAYVAYYPLPGQLPLWDDVRAATKIQIPSDEAHFRAHVRSPLQIYSNLEMTDYNIFEGSARGISLFAGMLTETYHEGTRYIHSPNIVQPLNIDANYADEIWQKYLDRTGALQEYSIHGKSIFYQAPSIAFYASYNEQCVDLGDHIFALDFFPTVEMIVHNAFMRHMPYDPEKAILYELFKNNLNMTSASGWDVKPDYELIRLAIEGDQSLPEDYSGDVSDIDIEAWNEYLESIMRVDELFYYQCNKLGIDYVFHEIYDYLMEPNFDEHPIDFFYKLDMENTP